MKQITEVTRRDIFDILNFGFTYTVLVDKPHPDFFYYQEPEDIVVRLNYWGRLDNELSFLKRLYNLEKLPSNDSRFKDAGEDIWQHTINNDDFELGWVFEDERFCLFDGNDDEYILNFLCEIFHPAVRIETKDWRRLLEKLNELLAPDGYNINPRGAISGRAMYSWKIINPGGKVLTGQMEDIKTAFDSSYVGLQVDLMYSLIDTAPHSAIGKAKELIEICCKTILDEQEIEYDTALDLTQLMKVTCDSIGLSPKKLKDGITGPDIAARILGNLGNIAHGMAELRNLYGDGHGKTRGFQPLPPRYAHLAVGASVATVHFMWDTYQERLEKQQSSS